MKKSKKLISLLLALLMLVTSFAGFSVTAFAGEYVYDLDGGKWAKVGGYYYYYNYDGQKVVSDSISYDGKIYVFDKKGRMITKPGWCKLTRSYSAWDEEEPRTVTNFYYINADGTARTGWLKLKNSWYYLDEYNGEMATGGENVDGIVYVFGENGRLIQKAGWVKIRDKYSDFDKSYYVNKNGTARTGWWKIGKKWLNFNTYDGEYEQFTKYQKVYFYDEDGQLVKEAGWHKYAPDDVEPEWSYTDKNGLCKIGWQTIGGKRYFFASGYGYRLEGIVRINGKDYFFNNKGVLQTKEGWCTDGYGSYYYIGKDGALTGGWQKVGKFWYYFDTDHKNMYRFGEYQIGGKTYVFDQKGRLINYKTGWVSLHYEGEYEFTAWYYMKKGGIPATGWQTIDNKKYYFSEEYGYMYYNQSVRIGDKIYIFNKNGNPITKAGWCSVVYPYGEDDSFIVWYYLDKDGAARTGWQVIGGKKYYFGKSDGAMATGVKKIAGKNCYFTEKGVWKKLKGWQTVDDNTYYFNKNGYAVTGTWKIGGCWYSFNSDGTLITDDEDEWDYDD